jgi:hypothetical protein
MLSKPVELPSDMRESALRHGFAVPRSARCESFESAASGGGVPLVALLCTQPLLRENERHAIAAFVGGTAESRDELRRHFMEVMRATGFSLPDSRTAAGASSIMLNAPWSFRGELRSLLIRATETWRPATSSVELPAEKLSDLASSSFFGGAPSDLRQVNYTDFKRSLNEFGLAYDGPVQAVMRKILVGSDTRQWKFPLTCTVTEQREKGQVRWTIEFEDMETLERAHVLLPPVLLEMRNRGSRLRPDSASLTDLDDDVITELPALCISTAGNTESARVEMVRLLWNLITTLDRNLAGLEESAA